MIKASLINLGCPKNLVDSENILGILVESGNIIICEDILQADVMLINTCAFIQEAKEESIDLILKLAQIKKEDTNKKIVVIGCLVHRYAQELSIELPEVDLWVQLPQIPQLPVLIENLINKKTGKQTLLPSSSHFLYDHETPRIKITPSHYAYIKIAEGCSNRCSYCAVPIIKGSYQSRKPDSIINEAQQLVSQGTKEIILIAQDTTSYGRDLKEPINLTNLLKELCRIDKLMWLRILYAHPAYLTNDLIKEISLQDKICNYIDLPLQHIDDTILQKMGRKTSSGEIKKHIENIRKTIPGAVIRSAFIVGFPGETEKQFHELLKFMEEVKFERLGIFTYSQEDGTRANSFPGQKTDKIKKERLHKAMLLQQEISKEINKNFLGKTLAAIVEDTYEEKKDCYIGRSYADAPDVDGQIYINCPKTLTIGEIVQVKITNTSEYDLSGEIV